MCCERVEHLKSVGSELFNSPSFVSKCVHLACASELHVKCMLACFIEMLLQLKNEVFYAMTKAALDQLTKCSAVGKHNKSTYGS